MDLAKIRQKARQQQNDRHLEASQPIKPELEESTPLRKFHHPGRVRMMKLS